ncbi:Inositol hexakisphosphate and diphosphoinositol-pentakisphosphate kinase [Parelaphostrongylus tenuis]|uniref:Inositol hexakisphosphate and diphosphoinositol-pentakisphosphate kinase n=1 Tax=Parelaphostrongylus tenuis TaxID=148309 RepID=A0AAD5R1N9_PARTN|nr:Inositol hexakisphosphate and diphosphoinositol-pentakisphosphate kinase [Parelaphostrongylus tenuis]
MKTTLVLATLVAVLYARTFKMETRSSGSLRARLIRANLYHEYLEQLHILPAQVLKKRSQVLRDYFDEFYIGNVTIGTPEQTVSLLLDTSSSNLWVIDDSCDTYTCNGSLTDLYTRHKFHSTKSSSLSNENTTLFILYESGGWCGGPLVSDAVSFAGMTIEKQEFVMATDISDIYQYMPFDGILGLGWPALAVGQITTPMQNVLPSLDAPLFTVWMDRKIYMSFGDNAGLVTYGAIDTTNCHSDINYVPLTSEIYWQFAVDEFSIGTYSYQKKGQAISDTGNSRIWVPTPVMDGIANQTGAYFDPAYEVYGVPCSTMMTQPNLKFTINGIKYSVPSVEYVLDVGFGPDECILGVYEILAGGFGPDWILGDTWVRTFCNIYDFGQKRIGFATAIHSQT